MRYSGITQRDREVMLQAVGAGSIDDLFATIPVGARTRGELPVRGPLAEPELLSELESLKTLPPRRSLVGGGLYHHFIPKTVHSLVGRSEWVTSYTPYQPEVSQGTLVMYYEFQTYVCMLTGQEIANGGMYDGSTALAEAVLMARRLRPKGQTLYVSAALHPEYRAVLHTYLQFQDVVVEELPVDPETGRTLCDLPAERQMDALAIVLQSPNFFGIIESAESLDPGAFLISVTTEAQSLAIVEPLPAHIAVGEMQSLGIPVQLGGPTAGFFATRKEYVRQMPGRLVGRTLDEDDHEAWCITLATREQFIRREKATSNICTASGLMCLRSVVYLSLLGKAGIQRVARDSACAAHAFVEGLADIGIRRVHSGPWFNECVIDVSSRPELYEVLLARGIVMGIPLERWWPARRNQYLVTLTELHYPHVRDLIQEVKSCAHHS